MYFAWIPFFIMVLYSLAALAESGEVSDSRKRSSATISDTSVAATADADTANAATATADTARTAQAAIASDSLIKPWNSPFWSFGGGWEFGGMPLFKEWEQGLPQQLFDTIKLDTIILVMPLPLTVKDRPPSYSVTFPATLRYTLAVDSQDIVEINLVASYMAKSFTAAVVNQTGDKVRFLSKSLSLTDASIGVQYLYTLSEKYFTITSMEKNYLACGVQLHPLCALAQKTVRKPGNFSTNEYWWGTGLSWQVGLVSMRKLSPKSGWSGGVCYIGTWYGRFITDGHHSTIGQLNPKATNASEPLQSISHRFILSFSLISTKSDLRRQK
ncbi:MAG: hypothetical protein JW795_02390 [Chitinivibrionales bacterium]|nr:hypothetical protein [Chitinivibrionales bacterium]